MANNTYPRNITADGMIEYGGQYVPIERIQAESLSGFNQRCRQGEFITVPQAAQVAGLTVPAIYDAINRGTLTALTVGEMYDPSGRTNRKFGRLHIHVSWFNAWQTRRARVTE